MNLIKGILARKPATISPTIPRLEPDVGSLRADPLDLDRILGTERDGIDGDGGMRTGSAPNIATPKHQRTVKRSKTGETPARITERSQSVGGLAGSSSVPTPLALSPSVMRLHEHFDRMEDILAREQISVCA